MNQRGYEIDDTMQMTIEQTFRMEGEEAAWAAAQEAAQRDIEMDLAIDAAIEAEEEAKAARKLAYKMATEGRSPSGTNPIRLVTMDTIIPAGVKWLWKPYIPLQKITILRGDPGSGKTSFAMQVAAIASRGDDFPGQEGQEPLPDEFKKARRKKVLILTAEDDLEDGISPKLISAKALLENIMSIEDNDYTSRLSFVDPEFEDIIGQSGAQLVIIDPIQAFLGATVDGNRANEVRPVMSHLRHLAKNTVALFC